MLLLSPRVDNRKYFTALLLALIAVAWLSLWLWGQSPYSRFLSHKELGGLDLNLDGLLLTPVFVAGWTLMTVAMMLPTSLPLITMFQKMVSRRADSTLLWALLLAGYVVVWTVFGVAVHSGDRVLHALVDQSAWLGDRAWGIGAATLVVAGIYQFTPLKYICLDKCRSPMTFITEYWHGSRERTAAFKLGIHHGIFCVGCCWSLMLLMFAVGVGSIGWMLALGAIMAIEKNMPWGRRLSAPLGLALVVAGLVLLSVGAPQSCAHNFGC